VDIALPVPVGVIAFAVIVFLAAYVTWIFALRLRSKESFPKSFLGWLRDLFDLAQGL